jgi:hypothetical protein
MMTVVSRRGMPMSSKLSHSRSDVSTSLWGTEPLATETFHPADLDQLPSKGPSFGKRASRALARFLITLCIGVIGTLAWQSYGDAARELMASSSPQLSWLAPQAAHTQTPPQNKVAPATPSPDQQQLNAMSLGLIAMRQSVDQLAAAQERMTNEITKLRAAQQEVLDKFSAPPPRPAAAPTHKPVPLTPPSQLPPR